MFLLIPLLADASLPSDVGGWVAGLGAITSTGFAVWFGYYTTTKTIPDLTASHQVQVEKMAASHQSQMDEIVDKFDAALQKNREEHRNDLQTFWSELKEERAARRADTMQLVEAIRSSTIGRPVV